jgi:Cu/Ag efflux protein CusF
MRKRISLFVAIATLCAACTGIDTPSNPSSSSAGLNGQSSPVPGSNNNSGNNNNNNQTGRVELKGIVTGLGGQCPAISFSVSGSPVMTTATTTFDDGACSTIKNGDQLEVEGVKQANNVVMASRVEKKNADDDDDDDNPNVPGRIELKGMVAGRTGGCPSITFSIGSSTVMTNASTIFDDGACSTVQNGDQVEVEGVRQANGVVLASRVEQKNDDNDDDDDDDDDNDNRHGGEVELNGSIGALSGACPAISFSVSGSTVSTSAGTRFDDAACSSLKNGDRVEVRGVRQTNNVVAASRVEKKK